jgi:hypothetical protein
MIIYVHVEIIEGVLNCKLDFLYNLHGEIIDKDPSCDDNGLQNEIIDEELNC